MDLFEVVVSCTDLLRGRRGGICILGEPLSGPAGRHLAVVNSTRPMAESAIHRSLTGGSPRLVTCELSRVCWLRCRQHNTHHMTLHKKGRKDLPRAENQPQAPFAKVCGKKAHSDFLRERVSNIDRYGQLYRS